MFEEKMSSIHQETAERFSPFDKRTYTVDEIQRILNISKPTAYSLVKAGQFRSVRIGGAIRISKKSFDEWLDRYL